MNRHDVITVIRDPQQPLGKVYSVAADGSIVKASSVKVGRATAVMRHVPDHEALQALLIEVANDPNAAIINAGFHGVEFNEEFWLVPEAVILYGLDAEMRERGRDASKGVHISDDGQKVLGRLKENVYPSRWQLLDRDVDEHTPAHFGRDMSFAGWLSAMSKILPGLDTVSYVRAESSSARVENPDGTRKAGSNGHVWIKVQDPDDTNRLGRGGIISRSVEAWLSWKKPRYSRQTPGKVIGHSLTTLMDQSVWTPGRIVFVGQPTAGPEFNLRPQAVEVVKGSDDALDTSRAEMTPGRAESAFKQAGITASFSANKDGSIGLHLFGLTDDTELERGDGSIITIAEATRAGKRFRCQAPFRASVSMAAFFDVRDGKPFVHDVGTGETHHPGGIADDSAADLVAAAISSLKDDAGAVFEPRILELLTEARATDPQAWARYRKAIKDSGAVPVAELDKLTSKTDAAGGVDAMFDEVAPWEHPVDGAAMLDEVAAAIRCHLVADDSTIRAASIWVCFTWLIEVVGVAPIANITAPEKRCGKSVLLGLMGKLSYHPLTTSNIAPAAMFRSIELWHPTLLIDEVDSFLRENEEARGILNSGFTRDSAFVIRCVGDDHMPTRFDTWGAKVLCGIGSLADTLHDRSIPLRLRRKLPGERVENLRHADHERFDTLRRKLARWSADHRDTVRRARPAPISGLNDRANDCWEPLLAISDAAGGKWPSYARSDALVLHGVEEDAQSIGVELLQDVHKVFTDKNAGLMFTTELLQALIDNDEARWATWNRGKPMTPRQLAGKLEGFGIKPKQLHVNATNKRGYRASDFDDAFKRYASPPDTPPPSKGCDSSATPLHPSSHGAFSGFASATESGDVADEKTPKPAPNGACSGVADRNTPHGKGKHIEVEI